MGTHEFQDYEIRHMKQSLNSFYIEANSLDYIPKKSFKKIDNPLRRLYIKTICLGVPFFSFASGSLNIFISPVILSYKLSSVSSSSALSCHQPTNKHLFITGSLFKKVGRLSLFHSYRRNLIKLELMILLDICL